MSRSEFRSKIPNQSVEAVSDLTLLARLSFVAGGLAEVWWAVAGIAWRYCMLLGVLGFGCRCCTLLGGAWLYAGWACGVTVDVVRHSCK